jgi:hypothetical protein
MTSAPRLWIVCPVYLDVDGFLAVREHARELLAEQLQERFGEVRFVAVDDSGGHDASVDRLRTLADVTLLAPPFNLGHQRALVFGLRTLAPAIAPADIVVTMDADGEDRPEDLPALLAPLLDAPSDLRRVVVARRTQRSESALFKLLYFCFRILFRTLTGKVIRSGNFAAFRGWFVHDVVFHPHFDLCYSSSFISLNLAVEPVPLARGRRYSGRSRMSLSRLLAHGVSMLLPFTERIAIRSLIVTAAIAGVSTLALVAFAVAALAFDASPALPVWLATLVIDLFALVGLGNLLVLFSAFVQSRGSLLRGLEAERHARV